MPRSVLIASESTAMLPVDIDVDSAQPAIVDGLPAEVARYGTAYLKCAYGDWTGTNPQGWKEAFCIVAPLAE